MGQLVRVAGIHDVAPGTVKAFDVCGKRIALCHVDGTFYAIADLCTHDNGPLDQGELDGDVIECPRHGARFDVRTGNVLCLPAVVPVPTYRVVVEGDTIEVEV